MTDLIDPIAVALDRTTKNYAVYESEDPLGEQQPLPSIHIALAEFSEEPPELLEISASAYEE